MKRIIKIIMISTVSFWLVISHLFYLEPLLPSGPYSLIDLYTAVGIAIVTLVIGIGTINFLDWLTTEDQESNEQSELEIQNEQK